MRRVAVPFTLAAVLVLAGCSGDGGDTAEPPAAAQPNDDFTQGEVKPTSKTYTFGQSAVVVGAAGGQLKVTPVGVLYHRGPYNSDLDGPANGWYVAVAAKVEAIDSPEAVAGGAGGGGFHWRGSGQTIWSGDGNATSAPWAGAVNGFGVDVPIEPGSPEVGVETFDVPAKEGGRLLYLSPEDNSITSWPLPAEDTGTGLDKVRARIKLFS